jgi:hypothetical protein
MDQTDQEVDRIMLNVLSDMGAEKNKKNSQHEQWMEKAPD